MKRKILTVVAMMCVLITSQSDSVWCRKTENR